MSEYADYRYPVPAVNAELAARMPWIVAEPGSFWSITSSNVNGIPGTALNGCLAMVEPVDPGAPPRLPTFLLLDPSTWEFGRPSMIPAQFITRAERLVLVRADNPASAYYPHDQDLMEQE
ncbi:hypothetical protein [Nocardia sp. NPDC051750]|uniref:hypothetical protein n=1 Tax=Nocardia sp. NPDC051750 TaxID=3364325 RepID=UPI0037A86965